MLSQSHRELAFPDLCGSSLTNLPTGVGLFHLEMQKWGMASTTASECGAKEQTAEKITSCPIYHHPSGARALLDVNKNLVTCLIETCPAI